MVKVRSRSLELFLCLCLFPPNNKEKQSFVAVHPLRTNDCVFQELLEFIVPSVVDFSDTPKSAAIGGVPLVHPPPWNTYSCLGHLLRLSAL